MATQLKTYACSATRTLRMGSDMPVDASTIPTVTSANTKAPFINANRRGARSSLHRKVLP